MTSPQMQHTASVLREVEHERQRQDAKWGQRDHPDGVVPTMETDYAMRVAQQDCESAADRGECTYQLILNEEITEAFNEADPVKLRAELIQCAAVCVAWCEKIDRDLEKAVVK